MVIHINPNRLNIPSSGKPTVSRDRETPLKQPQTREPAPARVEENFIPAPDSLATMIKNAVLALRRGVTWDRGTILNLLV